MGDRDSADGQDVIDAVNQRTGEAFLVRGDDSYTAVVDPAQQVAVELEDGLARLTAHARYHEDTDRAAV